MTVYTLPSFTALRAERRKRDALRTEAARLGIRRARLLAYVRWGEGCAQPVDVWRDATGLLWAVGPTGTWERLPPAYQGTYAMG